MAELDHLVVASADLDAGVAFIRTLTGVEAAPGGPHPGVGTHNALLTFNERTYFEIIAIDPDQPDPAHPRPFGLAEGVEPFLAGFAIHPTGEETIDDVVAAMVEAGYDPGPVRSMSRKRPDGVEISWRLTLSQANGMPFVIDWGSTPSPARTLPSMGELRGLTVTTENPVAHQVLTALDLAGVEVRNGSPSLVATISTTRGDVELR